MLLLDPLSVILPQMDFIKDMIFVMRMITLLGGSVVFLYPELFSSNVKSNKLVLAWLITMFHFFQVVYLLLLTVFIPQYLGLLNSLVSNPPDLTNYKDVCQTILFLIFPPSHSYVMHFKNLYLDLKLRKLPNGKELIKAKEDLKRNIYHQVKLELGLETVYQLVIMLILLFLSYTETPTETGLKTLFNEGLGGLALFLLTTSILLSLNSCVSSHCKALTICRDHFPLKSRLVASLYCLAGVITRVVAMVMYFAVPLGLFSLHRHFQGEQFPWSELILDFVGPDGKMYIGNIEPFEWSKVDRWKKSGPLFLMNDDGTYQRDAYGNVITNPDHLASPPDITLYIGFTLKTYLYIFLAHVVIHFVVIFIAKLKFSYEFRNGLNFLDKIIHCLENTNIAYNSKEWDDGKGDAEEHRRRMRSNWKEGFAVIMINAVFNATLLIPLFYFGNQNNN